MSTDQPAVSTEAIQRLIRLSSKELVQVLADLFMADKTVAFPILYYDGHMGHSVTLLTYDRNSRRFAYHDPWPGDSLLCRDYNVAGVDAQRIDGSWSVTSDELEKVIFAAFIIQPAIWSEYLGEKYYTTYDEFQLSDFWSFFHIRETGREADGDAKWTRIMLKTGGFQSEIDLSIKVSPRSRLKEGLLSLKRNWMIGPPYGLNPFALDVARSFIAALTPPPDHDAVSDIFQMLNQIRDRRYAEQLIKEGQETSNIHRALFTYLGSSPSFESVFPFSSFSMKNYPNNGADWMDILIRIETL
jgi:hypothetical protein